MGLTIRPSDLLGATFVVAPEGEIVHWSDEVSALLGIPAKRALRRLCWEVLTCPEEAEGDCQELLRSRDRGEVPHPFEVELGEPPRRFLCTIAVCQTRQGRYLLCQLHSSALDAPRLPALTSRETEILGLLARGEDTAGIAEALGIRTPTVRNHMRRLLRKLGAHSRLEAVVTAVRAGLVKV